MAVINHAKREINAKIVYFGSPGCGKGKLFHFIHQRIKPSLCGPLKTMPAGSDTLLFFDYIPFENSSLDGYRIRFHLYTMTGPVTNPGTWKMTLKGLDGLAFVTTGAEAGGSAAAESLRVLRSMLAAYGKDLCSLPRLWLSCGSKGKEPEHSECKDYFDENLKHACSVASGEGVLQSLAQLSQAVLQQLRQEYEPSAYTGSTGGAQVPEEAVPPSMETITLPEVRLTMAGHSVVHVPLVIQDGARVRNYKLSLVFQPEEG